MLSTPFHMLKMRSLFTHSSPCFVSLMFGDVSTQQFFVFLKGLWGTTLDRSL